MRMDSNEATVGLPQTTTLQAGESLNGLSTKTGISRSTLRRKLTNPASLTLAEVTALAEAHHLHPADALKLAVDHD